MSFASVYPLYVNKVERKGRSREELDQVICWLTGHDADSLAEQIAQAVSVERFFAEAPALNPGTALITGTVCGVRVETITDPLMQKEKRFQNERAVTQMKLARKKKPGIAGLFPYRQLSRDRFALGAAASRTDPPAHSAPRARCA